MPDLVLAVDFGTTNTVAVLGDRLVTVDGLPRMPSAVLLGMDGRLLVGSDAVRMGRATPDRLELRPKSRIDEDELLLGGTPVPTTAAIRAVLQRIVAEAARHGGAPPTHLILTHPGDWGPLRLGRLRMTANGLAPAVSTVAEPVAAAAGAGLRTGETLLVLDFGGGTCDAAVVGMRPGGLAVLACAGLPDLGGDDLDQVLVDHVLTYRPVPVDLRDRLTLRADAQQAKELLSGQPAAGIATPGHDEALRVDRTVFERLARPHLDRAVELARQVLTDANIHCRQLLLVGGSARIPMLARLLAENLGMDVRLAEEPELAVCLGAATVPEAADLTPRPTPSPARPQEQAGLRAQPRQQPVAPAAGRRLGLLAMVALGLCAVVGGAALTLSSPDPVPGSAVAVALNDPSVADQPPPGLPPVVSGRPVRNTAKPVRAVHQVRQPAQHGDTTVTVNSVTARAVVGNGQEPAPGFRWVAVNITVRSNSRFGGIGLLPGLTSKLTLLDDRGQRISHDPIGSIGGCNAKTRNGTEVAQCAVMQVPNRTPVKGVLYEDSTQAADPEALLFEVDIPATGDTTLPPAAGDLSGEPVEFREPQAVLRVRADLVADPSHYWPDDSSVLPGNRVVVVRFYLEAVSAGSKPKDSAARAALIDDRGVAIHPTTSAMTDCPGFGRNVEPGAPVYACLAFQVAADTPIQGFAFDTPTHPMWRVSWPWLKTIS